VLTAQTGPSPRWGLGVWPVKYRMVVATDRAILLLGCPFAQPYRPTNLLARLPRQTRIGPLSGEWGKVTLLKQMWVHRGWYPTVDEIDGLPAQRPEG
jgi:hypothetical protein